LDLCGTGTFSIVFVNYVPYCGQVSIFLCLLLENNLTGIWITAIIKPRSKGELQKWGMCCHL